MRGASSVVPGETLAPWEPMAAPAAAETKQLLQPGEPQGLGPLYAKTSLVAQIDAVALEVNLLRVDYHNLVELVEGTETSLAILHPTVQDLQAQMTQTRSQRSTGNRWKRYNSWADGFGLLRAKKLHHVIYSVYWRNCYRVVTLGCLKTIKI
ncbi:hypothetical protein NDU88_003154 [Pleurodeles waltl]|uniref:Uncharacterized protein n=1 Tax=Pleurodeles waltl TaxID=8319 RepID=A0AAV7L378_PLEWA|nr:hypothetical protein NDU88_003154 [Pleurodeles waltl]